MALPASACSADLWQHTYENQRLRVVEACTAVQGRVVSVHHNADGDAHIALAPDDRSVVNLTNAILAQGQLITEVVCEHPPTDTGRYANEVKSACAGYNSDIALPKIGDRVRITGAYVIDVDNGWAEIHPITRIEIIR